MWLHLLIYPCLLLVPYFPLFSKFSNYIYVIKYLWKLQHREKELSLHEKKKLQDEVQAKVSSANEEIEKVKNDLETVVKHLDQMNIGSELFLKEKKKQDIVKDLKMAFGDNIVSEYSIIFSCSYDC